MAKDVVVRAVLKGDQFNKGVQSMEASINRFSAGIQKVAGILATIFVGGALARAVTKVIEFGDQLDKTSKKLGIAVNDLAALRFAAERSGVGFEKMQVGIQQLQKNLLDFTRGMGESKVEFEAMGLTAKRAGELMKDPKEAFLEIGAALGKIPDAGKRVAFAMRVMGRAGADLLPFLIEGRKGMEALFEEEQRLAGDLQSFAESSAKLKDGFANLGTAWEGFIASLVTNEGPLLKMVNLLVDGAVASREFSIALFGGVSSEALKLNAEELTVEIQKLKKELAEIQDISILEKVLGGTAALAGVERKISTLQTTIFALEGRRARLLKGTDAPSGDTTTVPFIGADKEKIAQDQAALRLQKSFLASAQQRKKTELEMVEIRWEIIRLETEIAKEQAKNIKDEEARVTTLQAIIFESINKIAALEIGRAEAKKKLTEDERQKWNSARDERIDKIKAEWKLEKETIEARVKKEQEALNAVRAFQSQRADLRLQLGRLKDPIEGADTTERAIENLEKQALETRFQVELAAVVDNEEEKLRLIELFGLKRQILEEQQADQRAKRQEILGAAIQKRLNDEWTNRDKTFFEELGEGFQAYIDKLGDTFFTAETLARGTAETMQDAFRELFLSGEINAKNFGEALKRTFADVAASLVTSGLLQLIQKILNPSSSGGGGLGIGSFIGAGLSAAFAGFGGGGAVGGGAVTIGSTSSVLVGQFFRS